MRDFSLYTLVPKKRKKEKRKEKKKKKKSHTYTTVEQLKTSATPFPSPFTLHFALNRSESLPRRKKWTVCKPSVKRPAESLLKINGLFIVPLLMSAARWNDTAVAEIVNIKCTHSSLLHWRDWPPTSLTNCPRSMARFNSVAAARQTEMRVSECLDHCVPARVEDFMTVTVANCRLNL